MSWQGAQPGPAAYDHTNFSPTPSVGLPAGSTLFFELAHTLGAAPQPLDQFSITYSNENDLESQLKTFIENIMGGVWTITATTVSGDIVIADITAIAAPNRRVDLLIVSDKSFSDPTRTESDHTWTKTAYIDPWVAAAIAFQDSHVFDTTDFSTCVWFGEVPLPTGSGTGTLEYTFQIGPAQITLDIEILDNLDQQVGSIHYDYLIKPLHPNGYQCDRYYALSQRSPGPGVPSATSRLTPTSFPFGPAPVAVIDWSGAVLGHMNPGAGNPLATTTTDPLRQLPNHPAPALSDWLTPTNSAWVSTASTWVSSVVTGYDGGVLAGPQASAVETDVTVDVLNSGTYTARIRAHIPNVDTSLRMRLIRNTTEVVADFSWTGPYTTGDFASPAEFNSESFPLTMAFGDTLELELFTESYDSGTGQLRTVLTDAQKVLVVSMDLERDPTGIADPGTGTLWSWEADPDTGLFTGPTKAQYDVEYNALPVDSGTGRKVGDQSTGPAVGVGWFTFPINWEIPTMSAEGKLECFHKSDSHDLHCMLRARMTNDPTFVQSSAYLRAGSGQEYEHEIRIDVKGRIDPIAEGRALDSFGILWQGHPGTFPSGFSKNPPITIQLEGSTNKWIMWVRGETAVDPGADPFKDYHSKIRYEIGDWWSGVQTFRIQYKPNYTGVGTYIKLWHNGGDPVIDEVNMPIGLNYNAVSGQGNQAMQYTFGMYNFKGNVFNSRPDIDILKFHIRTLS